MRITHGLMRVQSQKVLSHSNELPTPKQNDQFEDLECGVRKFSVMPTKPWRQSKKEQAFLENPTTKNFLRVAAAFDNHYHELGNSSFEGLRDILIIPQRKASGRKTKREKKLAAWHEKKEHAVEKRAHKATKTAIKRREKIDEHGLGFGGRTTDAVFFGKTFGRGIKDYATIRGYMFHTSNMLCGTSLEELLPRYGIRNGGYIGIRISEFAINTAFMAIGYGLAPSSDGVSVIVANHVQTLTTLAGEAAAMGILGARPRKIITHATLRGAQLEAMKSVPVAGQVVQLGETVMQTSGNATIAASHIVDLVMRATSTRHASLFTERDLGDSRVLAEIDVRIDYLSRFLIPYGQWLLSKETSEESQHQLKKSLKKQSKILIKLEKKRENAIGFYQIALLGDRVPKKWLAKVMADTLRASSSPRKNCLRVARRCLATLKNENC